MKWYTLWRKMAQFQWLKLVYSILPFTLGKNKLERAISDAAYASGSYALEMEQTALMAEAKTNLR